jgi:peptide/nickel transport system permease protein
VAAGVILILTTGFGQRRAVAIVSSMAVVAGLMWLPGQYLFFYIQGPLALVAIIAIMAGIGIALGALFGGDSRQEISRAAGITGGLAGLVLILGSDSLT